VDVNGTKFHLVAGRDDWGGWLLDGSTPPLSALWDEDQHPSLEWDDPSASLRLARKTPLFPPLEGQPRLDPSQRRGAGRDHYGNWYWIDADESGIRFLPAGARQSVAFWRAADRAAAGVPADATTFAPCQPTAPPTLLLRGLAVTERHYLVVGDPTEHGLLVFDLHRGGTPLLLRWPDAVPFTPWDLAPTPDGGLLVLDHEHLTYWRLDSRFRLLADVAPDDDALFQPAPPAAGRNVVRGATYPSGYPLAAGSPPEPLSPISIEPGLAGNVLILDTDPGRPYSLVYEYHDAEVVAIHSLEKAVEAADPQQEGVSTLYSVVAHDFAFLPPAAELPTAGGTRPRCGCGCAGQGTTAGGTAAAAASPEPATLYVAGWDGKQAFAFQQARAGDQLEGQRDFWPLRRWEGKALVGAGDQVYYDFADRWIPLQIFVACHYAGRAVATSPLTFAADVPGRPFDSAVPGTVWHRLLLDAQIPPGASISLRARAADETDLLAQAGWLPQPAPYLRSGGAELPYYDPWADLHAAGEPLPDGTGTWELLLQGVAGRYLQVELTVAGSGRSTPALRALRAWYPRFSYADHYLPAIYREDPTAASFLDRWLANFEGLYTDLEDKIEHVAALFDPRTAPPDALAWLACWFGLALDPLWDVDRRRFFIRHADELFRRRGTTPGVEIALRLYLDAVVDDRLLDPRCWGQGDVRIVEEFLRRGPAGFAYEAPDAHGARVLRPLTLDDVTAAAHRFTVLVPHDLTADQLAMAERIVTLEKPAHTAFALKRYWDLFVVGEARLGLDTRLGLGSRFVPHLLGSTYLPEGYLEAPYPFDVADRMVLDRDRVGDLPPL
jgi:phage tail-like protein